MSFKKTALVTTLTSLTLILSLGWPILGCQDSSPSETASPLPQEIRASSNLYPGWSKIRFDRTTLDVHKRELLIRDLEAFSTLSGAVPRTSFFYRFFGVDRLQNVLGYLADNVDWIVGPNFKIPEMEGNGPTLPLGILADNIGIQYHYFATFLDENGKSAPTLQLDEMPLVFDRDHPASILRLDTGYYVANPNQSYLTRIETLIHEARHSHCPNGIPIIRPDASLATLMDDPDNSKLCGLMHSMCPKGHAYEGLTACDRSVDGPYAYGAVLMSGVVKHCTRCTEKEKQLALISSLDSKNRVIPQFDPTD